MTHTGHSQQGGSGMKNKTDTNKAYDLLKEYFRVLDEAVSMLAEWKGL